MKAPRDLRLAPGAIGSWAICLIAITYPSRIGTALLVLCIAVPALALWPRKSARHRSDWRGWITLTLLFGLLITVANGALAAMHVAHRQAMIEALIDMGPEALLEVSLTSDAKEGANGWGVRGVILQASSEGRQLHANAPLYIINAQEQWQVADQLLLTGKLSQSREQTLFLRSAEVHGQWPPVGIYGFVDRLRNGVRDASERLSPPARGLVPGVSIGDDRRLPSHMADAMRATSLTHITAVSGAHVAIVLGSVLAILARAPRWIKGVVAAGVLALMVVVVLPTPSVLRASGMGMLTIVAFSRKRPRLALPVLFFTTTLLLAYDPWLATSIGFALSVAATLGILLSAPPLGRFMGGGPLARALAVPTAAQMWCAPLLLTFDASIATYSIPANLLAMPALAPATLTGLASAVVGLFSPRVAGLIAHTGGYFAAWIITVATFFARLPGARLPWWEGTPGVISLIALAVLLMWAVRVISRRRTAPPE